MTREEALRRAAVAIASLGIGPALYETVRDAIADAILKAVDETIKAERDHEKAERAFIDFTARDA